MRLTWTLMRITTSLKPLPKLSMKVWMTAATSVTSTLLRTTIESVNLNWLTTETPTFSLSIDKRLKPSSSQRVCLHSRDPRQSRERIQFSKTWRVSKLLWIFSTTKLRSQPVQNNKNLMTTSTDLLITKKLIVRLLRTSPTFKMTSLTSSWINIDLKKTSILLMTCSQTWEITELTPYLKTKTNLLTFSTKWTNHLPSWDKEAAIVISISLAMWIMLPKASSLLYLIDIYL